MKNPSLLLALVSASLFSACASPGGPFKGAVPLAADVSKDPAIRAGYQATGSRAIISTQGKAATAAARRMFELGGNAIDAAIAASFAISVERPQSTGLGGGGFMVFHEAKTGRDYAIDFRERAPLRATERMYLDAKGEVVKGRSTDGILAVAVPGMVAGLLEIHQGFGSLPIAQVMQPAIDLAENGFEVYPRLAEGIESREALLRNFPASREVFFKKDGKRLMLGDRIVQKDLAKTLRLIAKDGKKAFYGGPIGRAILRESKRLGGILGEKDFAKYIVHWRDPIKGSYHGMDLVSMPPPSSGGTHVLEILNILDPLHIARKGYLSADAIHLEASAFQRAFADRAEYMGDPDFVKVPLGTLTSMAYADQLRAAIDPRKETPSDQVKPGVIPRTESAETTHFSIMDEDGNAIASTQTINGPMGSGIVVPGTGVVLNNEMDDFSAKPGVANLFGAIGGSANAIAPFKTPLSSMSPTILLRDGKPVMAVGAPGGTRIITCVAQTILNHYEFGLPLFESVAGIRFHHQWRPDELSMDTPGPGAEVVKDLQARGYKVRIEDDAVYCRVMATTRENDSFQGVSDPRDAGSAAGW